MNDEKDFFFMREAIKEAIAASERGEIPVGAVVVRGGEIIGRGSNARLLERAPFAHAEMAAISDAGQKIGSWRFDDCTIYVTLEPCPMCAGAIVQTRFARLVYGASDPRAGACGTLYDIPRDRRMPFNCQVSGGILAEECSKLLTDFFIRRRKKY